MAKKLDYEYCKAAPVLEWLGNKWAMAVLLKIAENYPVTRVRDKERHETVESAA